MYIDINSIEHLRQADYDKDPRSFNGWFKVNGETIDNVELYWGSAIMHVHLSNGKITNDNKGFCTVRNIDSFKKKHGSTEAYTRLDYVCENLIAKVNGFNEPLIWNGEGFDVAPTALIIYEKFLKGNKLHKLDGPALVSEISKKERSRYFIDGVEYALSEFSVHPKVLEFKYKENVLDIIRNS